MKAIQTIAQFQDIAKKKYESSIWPTLRDEEWRRSDPTAMPVALLERGISSDTSTTLKESLLNVIRVHPQTDTIKSGSLADVQNTRIISLMQQALHHSLDRFDLWRLMQLQSALFIHIPDGATIEEPLHFVLSGEDTDTVYVPLIVFLVGKHSKINASLTLEGDGVFMPAVISFIDSYAQYHFCEFQQSSLDSIVVSSQFTVTRNNVAIQKTNVQFGAMIANNRSYVRIEGTHADININGCYFANEDQLIDLRTYQSHIAKNSHSRVLYNGVAVDEAHTVYRGLIEVDHHAEETDAYLTNKNLLLSEEARMDSIPCLNINTNEVRCSHGSTTGSLDPNHLFYLQSRGMSQHEAQNLLVESFMESVLDLQFSSLNKTIMNVLSDKISDLEEV